MPRSALRIIYISSLEYRTSRVSGRAQWFAGAKRLTRTACWTADSDHCPRMLRVELPWQPLRSSGAPSSPGAKIRGPNMKQEEVFDLEEQLPACVWQPTQCANLSLGPLGSRISLFLDRATLHLHCKPSWKRLALVGTPATCPLPQSKSPSLLKSSPPSLLPAVTHAGLV